MKRIFLTFGFIPALVHITGKLSAYYSGNQFDAKVFVFTGVAWIIALFLTIFFSIRYSRSTLYNGYLSLKQAMKIGLGVTLITAITVCVFTYFYIKYINREYIPHSLELESARMVADKIPQAEITKKIKTMMVEVYTPFRIATSSIMLTLVAGAFMSFMSATFLMKNSPEQES